MRVGQQKPADFLKKWRQIVPTTTAIRKRIEHISLFLAKHSAAIDESAAAHSSMPALSDTEVTARQSGKLGPRAWNAKDRY
jgi:hypothetical protein